jgi:hypothetical protein
MGTVPLIRGARKTKVPIMVHNTNEALSSTKPVTNFKYSHSDQKEGVLSVSRAQQKATKSRTYLCRGGDATAALRCCTLPFCSTVEKHQVLCIFHTPSSHRSRQEFLIFTHTQCDDSRGVMMRGPRRTMQHKVRRRW